MFLRKRRSLQIRRFLNLRGLEPPTFGFMPNSLPVELLGSDIFYPMFSDTGSVSTYISFCKASIWNVYCERATVFIFDSRMGVLENGEHFYDRKCLDPAGTRTPTFGFMLNALRVELRTGPDICYHVFSNTGSGGINIFVLIVWEGWGAWTPTFGFMLNALPGELWDTGSVEIFSFEKLTFKMSTVRGQQHSFLLMNGCSWESVEHRSTWYSTKYVYGIVLLCWWRLQVETFSALLIICAGNSPATGEFPSQRPLTRSFDVFFDLCLNKLLRKQSQGWRFDTPLRSLWRHRNERHIYPCCTVLLPWHRRSLVWVTPFGAKGLTILPACFHLPSSLICYAMKWSKVQFSNTSWATLLQDFEYIFITIEMHVIADATPWLLLNGINTLRLRQNCHHFADTFKCTFLNEKNMNFD